MGDDPNAAVDAAFDEGLRGGRPLSTSEAEGGPQERRPSTSETERRDAFRELRAKAKRTEQLEVEVARLRADAAFRELGLTDAQRKAVEAVHEGEPTVEGYRDTAAGLAFIPPDQTTPDERAALASMHEATMAAEAAEAHVMTLNERIARARTAEELDGILANAGITVNGEPGWHPSGPATPRIFGRG